MNIQIAEKILKELGYAQDESTSYCRVVNIPNGIRRCGLGVNGFTFRDIGIKHDFFSRPWNMVDEVTFRKKAKYPNPLSDNNAA